MGSSRRHLQSGNSLSGSLHCGINNSDDDILTIPRPPLPPTSLPPHMIMCNDPDDDDMDMDDEEDDDPGNCNMQDEMYFNGSGDRFANVDSV